MIIVKYILVFLLMIPVFLISLKLVRICSAYVMSIEKEEKRRRR